MFTHNIQKEHHKLLGRLQNPQHFTIPTCINIFSNSLLSAMDLDHGLHCSAWDAAELLGLVILCRIAGYRCLNLALDEFWRCSGETLDAAHATLTAREAGNPDAVVAKSKLLLTQDEWRNIAADHIMDGATAYNVKPDGVEIRKDSVDHGCHNGGPYFVKKAVHKHLRDQPRGKNEKATVAGTQSLDRWWGQQVSSQE